MRLDVCLTTIDQSNSDRWSEERQNRMTASRAHDITKTNSAERRKQLFHNTDKDGNVRTPTRDMLHGIKTEPKARHRYASKYSYEVARCGLVVDKYRPWLACSPDGIARDSAGDTHLVEIKCPAKNIKDISELPYIDSNTLELKNNHKYYTQCQLQMYVTGIHTLNLFIYKEPNVETAILVPYNEDFAQSVVDKLEDIMSVTLAQPSKFASINPFLSYSIFFWQIPPGNRKTKFNYCSAVTFCSAEGSSGAGETVLFLQRSDFSQR